MNLFVHNEKKVFICLYKDIKQIHVTQKEISIKNNWRINQLAPRHYSTEVWWLKNRRSLTPQ